jgi:hypothetical protein
MRFGLAMLCCIAVGLSGCGGGGSGGGASVVEMTTAKVDVKWAARTKAVNAPGSALSVVITLSGAAADGSDIRWTANRDAAPAGYLTTYPSPALAKTGPRNITAKFYSQADGNGSIVGVATGHGSLKSDGSGISEIDTEGTIKSVVVVANQSVRVNQTKALLFAAMDADSNIVAVSPGSETVSIVDGQELLAVADSQMTGVTVGKAMVVVSIDGHPSLPTSVDVVPDVRIFITPTTVSMPINGSKAFTALVTGTNNNLVHWRVSEGTVGGTITADGLYTAPSTRGTYHVVVGSDFDTALEATAVVSVQAGNSEVIIQ